MERTPPSPKILSAQGFSLDLLPFTQSRLSSQETWDSAGSQAFHLGYRNRDRVDQVIKSCSCVSTFEFCL